MILFERVIFEDERRKKQASDKKWAIVSIASIPLVMTLGNSMLIPVLPTMEKELQITSFQTSLIITMYSVVAIFFIPIAGYLSDRWGRKNIIIPSLLFAAIGGAISAFASWKMEGAFYVIIIGRILQGVGAAGAFPIVLPLVGDMFRTDTEISSSLGIIETANTLGKVLSPILGALLAGILWHLPFFSIPVFCLISIFLVAFLVKSPKKENTLPFRAFVKEAVHIFRLNNRWLTSVFIIGGLLMFVLFGVLFYFSSILEERYGINDLKKGIILAIPLGSLCLASFITGKAVKRQKTMKWVTFFGIVILTASSAGLKYMEQIWSSIAFFIFSGIGIGVCLPCLDAFITQGIEKEKRGTISSFYSSMRFIGVALGPPVIALLMDSIGQFLFFVLTGVCLLACMISLFGIRPDH